MVEGVGMVGFVREVIGMYLDMGMRSFLRMREPQVYMRRGMHFVEEGFGFGFNCYA